MLNEMEEIEQYYYNDFNHKIRRYDNDYEEYDNECDNILVEQNICYWEYHQDMNDNSGIINKPIFDCIFDDFEPSTTKRKYETCQICYCDDFKLVTLKCHHNHQVCENCLVFMNNFKCPYCRTDFHDTLEESDFEKYNKDQVINEIKNNGQEYIRENLNNEYLNFLIDNLNIRYTDTNSIRSGTRRTRNLRIRTSRTRNLRSGR
jgi:hypothetical protein